MVQQAKAVNTTSDLATLLGTNMKTLNAVTDKMILCISSIIHDAKLNGETSVVVDIGLGTLSIDVADMRCKFIPSKELKAAIKSSFESDIDPIQYKLEEELALRLDSICNEVL